MFASTALIAALVKSQFPTDNAHNQLSAKTIEKVAASLTTETVAGLDYDNDASSSTGSQTTIVDESAGIRLQSRIANVLLRLFQDNAQEKTRLINVHHAIDYITYALSDIVFVYPGTAASSGAGYLGQDLFQWASSSSNILNANDQSVKVVAMETREGALQAVQGALEQQDGVKATVLTSTQALYSMIPNIHRLASQRVPVVFNVAAHTVDQDLVSHSHVDSVLAARQSGAVLLASTTVQEAHDFSVVAHILAHSLGLPVIHYFDGTLVNDYQKATLLSYSSLAQRVKNNNGASAESVLESFNYKAFNYQGDEKAETVLVTLAAGSTGLSTAVAGADSGLGLLQVRLYRPWNETAFLQALPATARRVVVLEEGDGLFAFNGCLYLDVAAAIRFGDFDGVRPRVVTAQAPSFKHLKSSHLSLLAQRATSASFVDLLADEFTTTAAADDNEGVEHKNVFGASFWDIDQDGSVAAASHLAQLIHGQDVEQATTYRVARDAFRLGGTVTNTKLVSNTTDLRHKSDYVAIHNVALVKEYDILGSAVKKAKVLLHGPWKHGDEIEAHLTNEFKLALTQLDIGLYTLDAARIAEEQGLHAKSTHLVYEAAFLLLNTPQVDTVGVLTGIYEEVGVTEQQQRLDGAGEDKRDLRTLVTDVVAAVQGGLTHVELLPPWTILEINDTVLPLAPVDRAAGLVDAAADDSDVDTLAAGDEQGSAGEVTNWHKAAWQLMFNDVYGTQDSIRPDLHEDTYLVKLTENRRLTPSSYDRNVFHLEFDTTESDLKYNLGDALGVHGINDSDEVKAFIKWYGLNENDVVLVPLGDSGKLESRTVFQVFSQVLDIFGRPSKKFYEALAEAATDPKEKEQLLYLVSAEGKEDFKKRVDETVTYEDLLREFTSAKPALEHLVHMVAPIKPRHYSIASSQKMHANSVHLLVVAVEWVNAAGKARYGQCTRYLANLTVGANVTVSIKPSVMKLPPLDSQPVIMAGLGTGMAPFRAFIQERYLAKKAGKDVGPVVLYFGSRNRGNEYLYGEELEAYHQDGVLSRMGLAFSRDQKEKIYIQHKMKEDAEMLHDYLINKNGHFYLCGPTWPCGDIKDAVVYGLNTFGGIDEKVASDLIEEWKEKERYILEVY
ncbi:unnamed protein product [Absidia cylindrospora]